LFGLQAIIKNNNRGEQMMTEKDLEKELEKLQYTDLGVTKSALMYSHLEALTENKKLKQILKDICSDVIPALKDWMQTTGYGEIHRRDKVIVKSAERILKDLEKSND
jgi:hypothetical protein